MAPFKPSPSAAQRLRGRVVVLTGGANGIGAATVRELHAAGAWVVFGDLDEKGAASLLASLPKTEPMPIFLPTDVTSYEANLRLFRTATDRFGRVDHAITNAAIDEGRNPWFLPNQTIAAVQEPPSTLTLDVNLQAVAYFARIALAYMRDSPRAGDTMACERSLTLLSSTAGFKESPDIPIYQATKHGVLGLMRSLRTTAPTNQGVRVNAVCPWVTDTAIVQGWSREWRAAGLPMNEPEDVAAAILGILGGGADVNGLAVVVEGGDMWDMEAEIAKHESAIWGERMAREAARGQRLLEDYKAKARKQSRHFFGTASEREKL